MQTACRGDLKAHMSISDWFSGKKTARHASASTPQMQPDKVQGKLAATPAVHASPHKIERLENRALIFSVVRDAMIRAGVLAASYKFKVLSLDAHGLQYLIMMDLVNQSAGVTAHLAEMEAMIVDLAKVRHDMTVTAVYWRVSEQVTTSPSHSPSLHVPHPPSTAAASAQQVSSPPATRVAPTAPAAAYEPLQEGEVAAFKRALSSTPPASARVAPGRVVTSGRRNPTPPMDFEDTQIADSGGHASPLSVTQYGELK